MTVISERLCFLLATGVLADTVAASAEAGDETTEEGGACHAPNYCSYDGICNGVTGSS